jgi:hypothetical protein
MNTTSPSLFPTLPPVDAPIRPSTNPFAVETPIKPREAPTTLTEESTDSGDNNNGALIGVVVGGIAAAFVIGSLIGFFVFRRPVESSNVPKPAVSVGVAPSAMTEGNGGHDNLLGPAQPMLATQPARSTTPIPPQPPGIAVAMPPPPAPVAVALVPSTNNNYNVNYKDQARTVQQVVPAIAVAYKDQARTVLQEVPAIAVAEMVALDVSADSAGSQKTTQSEPPGRIYTEI